MERIQKLAWFALAMNVAVILGGALVRATGSGAGCGRSWPTCEGQIIPAQLSGAQAIEFSHRAFSGLALVVVAVLFVVVRGAPSTDARSRQVKTAAGWAMVSIVGEALIGAGIVLFEWVNDDSSIARTIAVPLHLINTFILIGALAVLVWLTVWGGSIRADERSGTRGVAWGFGLMVLVAATGAVTALADTLFPKETIGLGDIGPTEAFLTNLRVFHPAIAAAVSIVLVRIVLGRGRSASVRASAFARGVVGIVLLQLGVGVLNVALAVPVWLQLVHLGLADALWIVFVWYAAEVQSDQRATVDATI